MNHFNHILRKLEVTSITDPVERSSAPILQLVLIILGTVPLLIWMDRVIDFPSWHGKDFFNFSFNLLMSAAAFWSLALLRRGKFQLALRQILVVIVIATIASHATIGLAENSFRIPIQLLWLFIAGLMAGQLAVWGMFAGLGIAILVGAAFDIHGGLPVDSTIGATFARIIMFALVALIVDRSASALRDSLKEAVARGLKLEAANARLNAEMAVRQKAQAQLLHAQRVEIVGRMASGLAHDFGHLRACPRFCVPGYPAGDCRSTRRHHEYTQTRGSQRSAG